MHKNRNSVAWRYSIRAIGPILGPPEAGYW
jgi:hypothetical protein